MSMIIKQIEAGLRYVSYKGVSQRYHLRFEDSLILNADITNNHPTGEQCIYEVFKNPLLQN